MKLSPCPSSNEPLLIVGSPPWQCNSHGGNSTAVGKRGKQMPDTVLTERDAVREIETSPIPQRFARGWHCLGPASMFKDGKPHAVEAFGTKLVVFQGEDGTLNVLNAF